MVGERKRSSMRAVNVWKVRGVSGAGEVREIIGAGEVKRSICVGKAEGIIGACGG